MTQKAEPHAVARLRAARLLRSTKPFLARGGPRGDRCGDCRLIVSHCICALRPMVPTRAGVCLLMTELETLKPSNTGWLIADVVPDTMAFSWARTEVNSALLTLLADPQWQPYVVFPGEFVAPERVVSSLLSTSMPSLETGDKEAMPLAKTAHGAKRPLFILLDATWSEARKIFKKSPYLNQFPVLSLAPERLSRYRLRRAKREDHLCTCEVAALCLEMAGDAHAADALDAYFDIFTEHYLLAKQQRKVDWQDGMHQRLEALRSQPLAK